MGNLSYRGQVPQNDPMFSNGPQVFSRQESRESSKTLASDTTGATQDKSAEVEKESMTPVPVRDTSPETMDRDASPGGAAHKVPKATLRDTKE